MSPSIKLVSSADNKDIPLKDIKVHMDICDQTCQYTIEQSYLNSDEEVIEAYYAFPAMANSSVYDFEASIDGRLVKTELKEKEQATKEYNQAISKGDKAFMMEQVDGDTFTVCLGNIPPKATVSIKIKCVVELKTEVDATQLRLNLPLTFMPKYTPKEDQSLLASVMTSIANVFSKPYDYTFTGKITSSDGLVSIDSKTHPIKLSNMKESSADFTIVPSELDSDIILTIKRNTPKSSMVEEYSPNVPDKYKYAYLCNIIPNFTVVPDTNVKDMAYVIVLDSSGSMDGKDFKNAVDAAKLFVSLLPFGSKFNLMEFNSQYTKFNSNLVVCSIEEKINATNWLDKLRATGGTEVLDVMKDAYESLKSTPGVIIFLSDGGVSNTNDVLSLVKKNKNIGVFTIGIGSNVSQQLIQEMASNSVGGVSEFINNTDDGLKEKVTAQLNRSQQCMKKCQQNNKLQVFTTGQYEMFPKMFTLYEGDVNTFHFFSSEPIVDLSYAQLDSTGSLTFATSIIPTKLNTSGEMIHKIAGVKLLNELANSKSGSQICHLKQDPSKDQMIEVSLGLGILSKYTSFIGVEVNDTPEGQVTTPVLKKVPLQIARKYNSRNESCFMSAAMPQAAFGINSVGSSLRNGTYDLRSMSSRSSKSMCLESMDYDEEDGFDECVKMSAPMSSPTSSSWFDVSRMLPKSVDAFAGSGELHQEISLKLAGPFRAQGTQGHPGHPGSQGPTSATPVKSVKTKPLPTVKLVVKVKLTDYVNLGSILTSKQNGVLPFASEVSVGDYIELVLEDGYNGIYKVISLGSVDTPWTLELF